MNGVIFCMQIYIYQEQLERSIVSILKTHVAKHYQYLFVHFPLQFLYILVCEVISGHLTWIASCMDVD